jgi:hypothetical protein
MCFRIEDVTNSALDEQITDPSGVPCSESEGYKKRACRGFSGETGLTDLWLYNPSQRYWYL